MKYQNFMLGSLIVLLIASTPLFANNTLQRKNFSYLTESLEQRLTTDADFQQLAVSAYNLHKVINNKEYFTLLNNYLKNNITTENKNKLLTAFGYKDEESLKAAINSYLTLLRKTQIKFPEILSENNRSSVIAAGKNVLIENKMNPSMGDCWLFLLSWNSFCMQYCSQQNTYDYYSCIWACLAEGMAVYGICWSMVE